MKVSGRTKPLKSFLFLSAAMLLFAYPAYAGKGDYKVKLPAGLDEAMYHVPDDNPMTAEKVELGRALYFDVRLSADDTVACATCHAPNMGFTDNQPVSTGIKKQQGGRSAPTVINRAFSKAQFWDGRAASLEEQAKGPLTNTIEMGQPNHDAVVSKLKGIEGYRKWFKKVFGKDINIDDVARAIAAFERTVVSGNSRYDRYVAGDAKALSESEKRGSDIFFGKGLCGVCHSGPNFADEDYHNIGVGWGASDPVDLGRYYVTGKQEDIGKFKTPTVRDITRTAPYMHDGSEATLEQVVEYYDRGGTPNPFLDGVMQPLNLTGQEKKDLVAFMKALEGEGWLNMKAPASFPE